MFTHPLESFLDALAAELRATELRTELRATNTSTTPPPEPEGTGIPNPPLEVEKPEEKDDFLRSMDARKWTKAFLPTVKDLIAAGKTTSEDDLEETIFGWICSAIMAGYDNANWQRDDQYIYILQGNGGTIVKIFYWEPSELEMDRAYADFILMDYKDVDASMNCTLYRWARNKGLMHWDGKADESRYNWKP